MKINIYAQKWINEDYNPAHEDWYSKNTEYIYSRCWASGGIIYGVASLIIISLIGFFSSFNLSLVGASLGVLMFCYMIYSVDAYLLSKRTDAHISYFFCFILGVWTLFRANQMAKALISLFGIVTFVYFCIFLPVKHMRDFKQFKKSFDNMEDYINEEDTKKFEDWKNSYYKKFGYGENDTFSEEEFINNDHMADEARALFEGFTDSAATLKKRYRALARTYHPDAGGDEEMFKRIVTVYEELNKKFA